MWEKLQEKVKESQERWKEINNLHDLLKSQMDSGMYDEKTKPIISLLLLMVEQYRPMADVGDEANKLVDDITDMIGKLGIKV